MQHSDKGYLHVSRCRSVTTVGCRSDTRRSNEPQTMTAMLASLTQRNNREADAERRSAPRAISSAKLIPSDNFAPTTANRIDPCEVPNVSTPRNSRARSSIKRLTVPSPALYAEYSLKTLSTSEAALGSQKGCEPSTRTKSATQAHFDSFERRTAFFFVNLVIVPVFSHLA